MTEEERRIFNEAEAATKKLKQEKKLANEKAKAEKKQKDEAA